MRSQFLWRRSKLHKKHYGFRLSDLEFQVIEDYRARFNLPNTTEALGRILTRHKYYESIVERLGVSKPQTDEELACISRIQYDGQHYCVYKPPRMKELETIDICLVCKKRKLGLTESSITVRSEAQTVSEDAPDEAPDEASPRSMGPDRSQFKQNPRIRGDIYCHAGGLYVFAAKCLICKRDRYATWDDCKTKPNGVKPDGINGVQSGSD